MKIKFRIKGKKDLFLVLEYDQDQYEELYEDYDFGYEEVNENERILDFDFEKIRKIPLITDTVMYNITIDPEGVAELDASFAFYYKDQQISPDFYGIVHTGILSGESDYCIIMRGTPKYEPDAGDYLYFENTKGSLLKYDEKEKKFETIFDWRKMYFRRFGLVEGISDYIVIDTIPFLPPPDDSFFEIYSSEGRLISGPVYAKELFSKSSESIIYLKALVSLKLDLKKDKIFGEEILSFRREIVSKLLSKHPEALKLVDYFVDLYRKGVQIHRIEGFEDLLKSPELLQKLTFDTLVLRKLTADSLKSRRKKVF